MDGYSLDAQKDKLCKYAEYQDMAVVSEFSDEGFSGKNIKDRPEFSRMMEKIESGGDSIDFVLVFKLSQRKPDDVIEIDMALDELDITSAETKAAYREILPGKAYS